MISAELARGLSFWRSIWLVLVAFAPCLIIVGHSLLDEFCDVAKETLILAGIVQVYYVRFAIFFGCLGAFMHLLRGEVAYRTLHYLFLAPVRREILVLGKFVAGVITTALVFGMGVVVSFALMYGHSHEGRAFVSDGPGLSHLLQYVLVSTLACVGYGAVFLGMSILFRNPVISAVLVFLWEGINGALPVWLKHFGVTFYLKPLFPVELPVVGLSALFTVVAEPMARWVAVAGLLSFTAAVVAFACWRIRRFEVSYSVD